MPRPRHQPERRCIGCGRKLPKAALVRIVRTPEGAITPDVSGKLRGRGAYLCRGGSCWQQGLERGALERGLRSPVTAQDKTAISDFFSAQRPSGPSSPNFDPLEAS